MGIKTPTSELTAAKIPEEKTVPGVPLVAVVTSTAGCVTGFQKVGFLTTISKLAVTKFIAETDSSHF